MGDRGPKPTPTATLKLRGSNRADLNKSEPQPEKAIPPCPEWLEGEAKAEWARIIPLLVAEGVLTEWDRVALALYCEAYAQYVTARGQVTGPFIRTKNGNIIQNPAISLRNKAWERLLKAAAELGLTPSARSKISIIPQGGNQNNPKTRFFNDAG